MVIPKKATKEEREVYKSIKDRDLRELEKALIKSHQAWLIVRKRANKYDLTHYEQLLDGLQRKLLYELYTNGVVLIFQKHAGILLSLNYTGEDLLAQWKKEGILKDES